MDTYGESDDEIGVHSPLVFDGFLPFENCKVLMPLPHHMMQVSVITTFAIALDNEFKYDHFGML